jgi:hypothetical protein
VGSGCSFAGGGVGRLESGTHEARYCSNSSSSMSEKLLRMDSAGEAMFMLLMLMLMLVLMFPWLVMVGSVHGSRSLQCGFVEGSFQVNNLKQNLCRRRKRSKQTDSTRNHMQSARRIRQAERRAKARDSAALYIAARLAARTHALASRASTPSRSPKRGVER